MQMYGRRLNTANGSIGKLAASINLCNKHFGKLPFACGIKKLPMPLQRHLRSASQRQNTELAVKIIGK